MLASWLDRYFICVTHLPLCQVFCQCSRTDNRIGTPQRSTLLNNMWRFVVRERLRDGHGFAGGYIIVGDYVRARRQLTREALVPLHHSPGHAQVDFGEAVVEVGTAAISFNSARAPTTCAPTYGGVIRRAGSTPIGALTL